MWRRVYASTLLRASRGTEFPNPTQGFPFEEFLYGRWCHSSSRVGEHKLCICDRRGCQPARHLSTRQHFHFQLSRVQINIILRSQEQSVSIPDFDGSGVRLVRKFESNQLAANTPNEDRRSAATCLQAKGMLFGVFDGHGGWACAQAISERLLYYITIAMMPKRSLEELEVCMEHGRPLPSILQWYKHHADFNYMDQLRVFWQELLDSHEHGEGMCPSDAMHYAFKRLDADISLEAQVPQSCDLMRSTAIQVAFAGSTACVAHVGPDGIHVANAGDSRAVLGVQEADGSWSAVPLSQDHNCQNRAEVERIMSQHPSSERNTVVTDERLLGVLMPSRAFGDVRFKWSPQLQKNILESLESGVDLDSLNLYNYTLPNYGTPPYLDAAPEVTCHKVRPQDRFLILGTDGLWDELTNEDAVRLVGEHLSGIHLQAPVSKSERRLKLGQMHELLLKRQARASPAADDNAATHLIRHALGTGEYGELCQERLASMLALPEDLARMYRDDITATVVYLNGDLTGSHRS
ncbi:pyruvate dehydrogenase [acetyl-transferring]-phosphatase 2, mitochondrial [Nerophis ophidion]|uniref:pyruvate dehydrogenase [acetyl-transferring]-phosphatase 2, mitochondrial n=1 Tax=Nerophis ophidion TaxID=159077 RepID=UPI002AE07A38|nr:pyruvate dehydrogenase [acetyl-transferring]-phosphatase 2, mitochondrial [Nerophis ophidion]XP_061750818.1 pyruvate dehydrogenase [acetyl-transferring]-phosphatase 2, mitochondrial [Nerophis ophidion]